METFLLPHLMLINEVPMVGIVTIELESFDNRLKSNVLPEFFKPLKERKNQKRLMA